MVISLFIVISVNLTGVYKIYLDIDMIANTDLDNRPNADETATHDLSLVEKYCRRQDEFSNWSLWDMLEQCTPSKKTNSDDDDGFVHWHRLRKGKSKTRVICPIPDPPVSLESTSFY